MAISKTLFLMIFDPRWSIVKSVFDCCPSGVLKVHSDQDLNFFHSITTFNTANRIQVSLMNWSLIQDYFKNVPDSQDLCSK